MNIFCFMDKYEKYIIHKSNIKGKFNDEYINILCLYIPGFIDNDVIFPSEKFSFWIDIMEKRYQYFGSKSNWKKLENILISSNTNEVRKVIPPDLEPTICRKYKDNKLGQESDKHDYPNLNKGDVVHVIYYNLTHNELVAYDRVIYQKEHTGFLQNDLNYLLLPNVTITNEKQIEKIQEQINNNIQVKSEDLDTYNEICKHITSQISEMTRRLIMEKYRYPNCTMLGLPVFLYMNIKHFEINDYKHSKYLLMNQSFELTKNLLQIKDEKNILDNDCVVYFPIDTLNTINNIHKFVEKNEIKKYDKLLKTYSYPIIIDLEEYKDKLLKQISNTNEQFNKSIFWLKDNIKKLSSNEKLKLYGLFKQIMYGNNNFSKPLICDYQNYKKWKEWEKNKNMSKEIATQKYVELVNYFKISKKNNKIIKYKIAIFVILFAYFVDKIFSIKFLVG